MTKQDSAWFSWKSIPLGALSLFLIYQSWQLLLAVNEVPDHGFGGTLLLAWLLNMFVTGIFAFAGFGFPTQRLLPKSYYRIKTPERLQHVYRVLRVDWFRQVLLATLWRQRWQRRRYFNGRKSGMAHLWEQSCKSEFGHLLSLILICLICILLLGEGLILLGIFTLIINLLGNGYPVILQRHHRMRIQRLM